MNLFSVVLSVGLLMIAALADMSPSVLIVLAIIGFMGQTTAVVVGAYLSNHNARKAQDSALAAKIAEAEATTRAQVATAKAAQDAAQAQADAAKAQAQAAEAARQLVIAAKSTDIRLAEIKAVTDTTHIIVNNQRTVMLRLIATLARRIAADNPRDKTAAAVAAAAEREWKDAEEAAVKAQEAPKA